jgi:hypothetical protein
MKVVVIQVVCYLKYTSVYPHVIPHDIHSHHCLLLRNLVFRTHMQFVILRDRRESWTVQLATPASPVARLLTTLQQVIRYRHTTIYCVYD